MSRETRSAYGHGKLIIWEKLGHEREEVVVVLVQFDSQQRQFGQRRLETRRKFPFLFPRLCDGSPNKFLRFSKPQEKKKTHPSQSILLSLRFPSASPDGMPSRQLLSSSFRSLQSSS